VAPQPAAAEVRQLDLWLNPHGFLKAAMMPGANPVLITRYEGGALGGLSATRQRRLNIISITVLGKYRVNATINDQNLVERVEYLSTNSVVGDVPVEITYSDYANFGDVQFPTHVVEKQDGFETLDLTIKDVMPNAPVAIEVPANVASAPPPAPVTADVQKVGDGLWSINAANTRSLAVEFRDHIVMLEGPTSDARSAAANELVRKTVPNKPIRAVVNTHAHYDHAGGLRQYVAEGITVITHESSRVFFEGALAAPATMTPDRQQAARRTATVEGVRDKRVLTTGARSVEIHHIAGNTHADGMLMVYLPKERLLIQADAFTPGPPNSPAPTPPNAYHLNLVQNLERLKLQVERILPLHGRIVPAGELYR
ncbi:MAG: MBL fold metallo-hydrolase, partial [Burkholderiales bacterium]